MVNWRIYAQILCLFGSNIFFRPKNFGPVIFLDSKIFLNLNLTQNFSEPKFFLHPRFLLKFFLRPKIGFNNFFGPKINLDETKFWTNNFFGPIFLQTHAFFGPDICVGLGDFHWRWGIKPFQAEHFWPKSCLFLFPSTTPECSLRTMKLKNTWMP